MKKIFFLFTITLLIFSCDKDLVKKPDDLIDLKVMKNIFYDMALLDAIKYQNSDSLYKNGVNPKTYVFKKYKVDSLQYVKSNAYYASDLKGYKMIFDELNERLKKEKEVIDAINKKAEKKANAANVAKGKKIRDSIIKAQKAKELDLKKKKDSLEKVNSEKKKLKLKK
jgi:hypothetical protein